MINTLNNINNFINYKFGAYYIILGILFISGVIILSLSKYGKIKLGNKKSVNDISWMTMMFTATLASDVLFFSLHEWKYYYESYSETYLAYQPKELVASTYPLFHWGFIAWSFYLLPAVAYAYWLYKKKKNCDNYGQACFNKNNLASKILNIVGALGLLISVSTTFTMATPLLASSISKVFNIQYSNILTIFIIIIVAVIYLIDSLTGIKGISKIANISCIFYGVLLVIYLISSGEVSRVIGLSLSSLGNIIQNQIGLSTYISETTFTNDWTIFYWSYWIAWSIATPFFIAKISEGRTIRDILIRGLLTGTLGSWISFMILGNSSMLVAIRNNLIESNLSIEEFIMLVISNMKYSFVILILIIVCMILMFANTLDSIIWSMSQYLGQDNPICKILLSIMFAIIPIIFIYNNSAMEVMKILSIIVALPISFITIFVVCRFLLNLIKDK